MDNIMKTISKLILISSVAGVLGACAGMTASEKATAVGAGVGAIGGAVVTGGSGVGTVIGAGVGGVVGHEIEKKK
jgi:osmotically inducible lipoprotein OsmB